jgi:hypothetical protein
MGARDPLVLVLLLILLLEIRKPYDGPRQTDSRVLPVHFVEEAQGFFHELLPAFR